MKSQKSIQTGASLIEVLVAILIFSFGLLGLIGLQTRAIQFSGDADGSNMAALMANEAAAQMYTLQNANLPAAAGGIYAAWRTKLQTPALSGLPNGDGTVVFDAVTNTSTITVTWQNSSDPQPRAYSTVISGVAGVTNP